MERLNHHVQVPSGSQSNFHLIKALRISSKTPKHELYFSSKIAYDNWEPSVYRTMSGHSGDVVVEPCTRDSIA
eukprot:2346545-Karenia_brevis.AAC.1